MFIRAPFCCSLDSRIQTTKQSRVDSNRCSGIQRNGDFPKDGFVTDRVKNTLERIDAECSFHWVRLSSQSVWYEIKCSVIQTTSAKITPFIGEAFGTRGCKSKQHRNGGYDVKSYVQYSSGSSTAIKLYVPWSFSAILIRVRGSGNTVRKEQTVDFTQPLRAKPFMIYEMQILPRPAR